MAYDHLDMDILLLTLSGEEFEGRDSLLTY